MTDVSAPDSERQPTELEPTEPEPTEPEPGFVAQPYLHDLVSCVRAPALALSGSDGQIREGGVHGLFRQDRRALSRLVVRVDGAEPVPALGQSLGAAQARFVGIVRAAGDPIPDPTVTVERHREVAADGAIDRLRITNAAQRPVTLQVEVEVASDLAPMAVVKAGQSPAAVPPSATGTGLRWSDGLSADPTDAAMTVALRAQPAPDHVDAAAGRLRWDVSLERRAETTIEISVAVDMAPRPGAFTAVPAPPWRALAVETSDHRVPLLVDQGLADLAGLLLADEGDPFTAAGSPWFFTLFGRDSLIAARMLLPTGTDLALGTLRTLARRQGTKVDLATEEQPGKILHEVRPEDLVVGDLQLPPLYYGTVDATPLWISLLADAWRWGADPAQVERLLPAAERALGWLTDHADSDGDGFLEYVDHTGHGLGNQGWKDSEDSVQWHDGRLADAPIALCEVQAYAYAAALDGAELLEAYGRSGTDRWRAWADTLRQRFRAAFWVEDAEGPYPAIALDRDKRQVDGLASNMGHLLGTGILDREEATAIARRLGAPDMDCGFGLRTLSARSARFSPLSYHGGAVWPHDTALTILGLAREGCHEVAASLARGLLAAAPAFDYRLPELYGGEQALPGRRPLPYPASCRPQAWAAASGVAIVAAAAGVAPNAPAGTVTVAPMRPAPFGAFRVSGMQVAGEPLDLAVAADGTPQVLTAPRALDIVTS